MVRKGQFEGFVSKIEFNAQQLVIEALTHMRNTGVERIAVMEDGRNIGWVTFAELTNFLGDEDGSGDVGLHKLHFDLGSAIHGIRHVRSQGYNTAQFLKPLLTVLLILLSAALLFSKPLMRFVREVMKKLHPVEVVVPKKVAKKVDESFYFRNKPLEEIMGMLAEWNDLEVVYEDDFLRKIRYGGSISSSQSLERTLEVIEFSGGLRFMVQGRKVFVLRIVR